MAEYYLKILSGNHLGAEIPLTPGRYSLGKGNDCDLILTDTGLGDSELIVEITDDGALQVTSNNQQTLYVSGEPVGESITINAFDIVTASGIHFALGPADAEWPHLAPPALKQPEPPATDSTQDGFPDPDADENSPASDSSPSSNNDQVLEEAVAVTEDQGDSPAPLAIDKRWLIGIPAVLACLLILAIALLFLGTPEQPAVKPDYLAQAKRIIQQLQLKDITLKPLPDKRLLVTGYTPTRQNKQALQEQLKQQKIPHRARLVAMHDMRTNAEALLISRGYKNLSVELDNTAGALVLKGYVVSSDQLDKVINMLTEEVYGLKSVVDQVENQGGRVAFLKTLIRSQGLSARLRLIERPGKVLLQGLLLDEEQVYKLNDIVTQFQTRFGQQPELVVATKRAQATQTVQQKPPTTKPTAEQTPADKRQPAFTIKGVSMGPIPYVIMEDGGKYLIGAELNNGYTIEAINLDYLLLTNGTQRIKYPLGGSLNDGATRKN